MGLNSASWGYIESICPGGVLGLLSKIQDEVQDFFEKLAWNTSAFEQANENLDAELMASLFFMLILPIRTTL